MDAPRVELASASFLMLGNSLPSCSLFILFISTVGYDIVSAIDEENSETIIVTTDLENSDINSLNTEELGLMNINSIEIEEEIPDFDSEESKQKVQDVINAINNIPEYNENMSEEKMEDFFFELELAYIQYEDLYPEEQLQVTNSDKISWYSIPETIDISSEQSYKINAINCFGLTNQVALIYGDGNKTIKQISKNNFLYWDAYVLEQDADGRHIITKRVLTDSKGTSKGTLVPPTNGCILLFHGTSADKSYWGLSVGDEISIDFDYRNLSSGTNKNGFGTIGLETDIIRGLDITAVNSFDTYGNTVNLIYDDTNSIYDEECEPMTVKDACLDKSNSFYYWVAYILEESEYEGYYDVVDINLSTGSKMDIELYKERVVLMAHGSREEMLKKINIGDYVSFDFDFKSAENGINRGSYGTVFFTNIEPQLGGKEIQNNNLTPIDNPISTKKLIDINLYDFSYVDENNHINTKFNEDNKYPGFQNPEGVKSINKLTTDSFKFGDNVTKDFKAGRDDVASSKLNNINGTMDNSNYPVSKKSNVMKNVIGEDGYPALADGTSLAYLFDEKESYVTKMNSPELDGLFQYNEETGEYFFDCRSNHAQFNQETNHIDLYNEKISANFIMYPWGNFLPFNNIQTAMKADIIDRQYFRKVAVTAKEKSENEEDETISKAYLNLSNMLNGFVSRMDEREENKSWKALDVVNAWFEKTADVESGFEDKYFDEEDGILNNVYSIDYDDLTNFYFGMTLEMDFAQPRNGMTGVENKYPMLFNFAGDDDVWVYIDGILFLDLSGIHRHVGGKIDYKEGIVNYYALDPSTGDIYDEPYKTVTFEEIISDALGDEKVDELLKKDKDGNYSTFKDYGQHHFKFYYMERGSGSSVCKMNFNFPLLKSSALTIGKEVSIDDENIDYIGNPDYIFQIMKANENDVKTENSFFAEGEVYNLCTKDEEGNLINLKDADGNILTDTVKKNGFIILKDGEYANFPNVPVGTSCFYVRELLDRKIYEQYDRITSLASVIVEPSKYVNYDKIEYAVYETPIYHLLDGDTFFEFNNRIITKRLGALEIEKTVSDKFNPVDDKQNFEFSVKIDEKYLPVGTKYFIDGKERTVQKEGIILLKHNEKAEIKYLLSGSLYEVTENNNSDYDVKYMNNTGTIIPAELNADGNPISPTVRMKAINVKKYGFEVIKRDIKTKEEIAGAEFELKNENIFIKGISDEDGIIRWTEEIPYGTYQLTETKAPEDYHLNDSVWTVILEENNFSMTSDKEISSKLIKDKKYFYFEDEKIMHYGNLDITKTISGTELNDEDIFKLHIVFSNKEMNGRYGDVMLIDGEGDISIKANETKHISNIIAGTEYEIKEIDSDAEMTVIEGTLNGTVSEGDNFVKLNNHKDKALYDLTITKTISGTDVSKDDIFTFKLTLSDKLEGTYGDLLFKEGVSIFTLKADESKTAKQIEEGVIYDIEELDAEEYIQTVNENLSGIIAENTKVTINNHKDKKLGNLVLKKTASGTDVDVNTKFSFKITLSNKINKDFGNIVFENGIANVQLKPNESIEIMGLEEGTEYIIEETTEGYDSSVTKGNLNGKIVEGMNEVTVNNHRDKIEVPVGDIIITKTISGTALNSDDVFRFEAVLSDKTVNGNYGDVSFKDGTADFNIKANETITIKGLKIGTDYSIKELDSYKYETKITSGSLTGTVSEKQNKIIINNHLDRKTGNISIKKTISGDGLTADDSFRFKMTLSEKLNGKYGDLIFKDGISEFMMKANDTKKIIDLKVGTTYQLSETDGKGADLKVVKGSMNGTVSNGDIQIEINNHKDKQSEDIVIKQDDTGIKSDSTQDKTTITEDLIDIKDEQTPQASPNIQNPSQTGDDAPIGILVLLLFTSGICSIFCLKRKKK